MGGGENVGGGSITSRTTLLTIFKQSFSLLCRLPSSDTRISVFELQKYPNIVWMY